MSSKRVVKGLLSIVIGAAFVAVVPLLVAETNAEEAPGGYQSKPTEDQPINICAGCVTPLFSEGSKGSLTPYGRIELDALYSTRNTNPLDPQQFNGYGTAPDLTRVLDALWAAIRVELWNLPPVAWRKY